MRKSNFVAGFIEAALWSSTYEHPNCEDCRQGQCNPNCDDGEHGLSDNAEAELTEIAEAFFDDHNALFTDDNLTSSKSCGVDAFAGHDFWLTSQGHGCGFWAGDWIEPVATTLTEASKCLGERYFYVNSSGDFEIE
jgi:hypothetical protein